MGQILTPLFNVCLSGDEAIIKYLIEREKYLMYLPNKKKL